MGSFKIKSVKVKLQKVNKRDVSQSHPISKNAPVTIDKAIWLI